MYIGIICSCMPALSKTFHYHLPTLKSLGSFWYTRLSGLRWGRSGSGSRRYVSKWTDPSGDSGESDSVRKADVGGRSYYKISAKGSRDTKNGTQAQYELSQMKAPRSFIEKNGNENVVANEDRIHLTTEVRVQNDQEEPDV